MSVDSKPTTPPPPGLHHPPPPGYVMSTRPPPRYRWWPGRTPAGECPKGSRLGPVETSTGRQQLILGWREEQCCCEEQIGTQITMEQNFEEENNIQTMSYKKIVSIHF